MTIVFKIPCCGDEAEYHDAEKIPDLPEGKLLQCPRCNGAFLAVKFAQDPLDVRFFECELNEMGKVILAKKRAQA